MEGCALVVPGGDDAYAAREEDEGEEGYNETAEVRWPLEV
jgi:hypothetical protein